MFGEFDEAAYLRANPDVRGMIERGLIRSGFEHWHAVGANEHALGDRVSGFYEHDLIYDEALYLRQNPDVADAVRARAVRNGYQHWIRFGRQEFARGVRLGPFRAPGGVLRPFRVSLGRRALFVARAPDGFERASRVEIRVGFGAPVALDSPELRCSKPLRVVDVSGDAMPLRLLVLTSPPDLVLDDAQSLGRVAVAIHFGGAEPLVSVYRDGGIQAFFFPTADDASEFVSAARAGRGDLDGALELAIADFALGRMVTGPRTKGYEKPLSFRIEETSPTTGGGLVVRGWVAVPQSKLAAFRAWRPERAEFVDITKVWSRSARPDIVERFPSELAGQGNEFGFSATLPFPDSAEGRGIWFGLAADGSEQWVETEVGPG